MSSVGNAVEGLPIEEDLRRLLDEEDLGGLVVGLVGALGGALVAALVGALIAALIGALVPPPLPIEEDLGRRGGGERSTPRDPGSFFFLLLIYFCLL